MCVIVHRVDRNLQLVVRMLLDTSQAIIEISDRQSRVRMHISE